MGKAKRQKTKDRTLSITGDDFRAISKFNMDRNVEVEKFQDCKDWSETDWGCALAGEVGELCNNLKKRKRKKGKISVEDCEKEMADVFLYLDLLASKMKIDLVQAIVNKFNEVSERIKTPMKMVVKK